MTAMSDGRPRGLPGGRGPFAPGDLAALASAGLWTRGAADVAVGAGDRNRLTLSAGATRACTARR